MTFDATGHDSPGMAAKRSVIFIPHQRERERWERACHEEVTAAGGRVVAVVGLDGQGWADAQAMIDRGEADEIVVARWDHIPAEALPHVRVVAEPRTPTQRRRPRITGPAAVALALALLL